MPKTRVTAIFKRFFILKLQLSGYRGASWADYCWRTWVWPSQSRSEAKSPSTSANKHSTSTKTFAKPARQTWTSLWSTSTYKNCSRRNKHVTIRALNYFLRFNKFYFCWQSLSFSNQNMYLWIVRNIFPIDKN